MSEVVYLNARLNSHAQSGQPARSAGTQVYVREALAGMWIVHDEADKKGGCFRSHDAAFRFAEEEFGAGADIVVQPHFSLATKRTFSHFKQSTSVAHRALAVQ